MHDAVETARQRDMAELRKRYYAIRRSERVARRGRAHALRTELKAPLRALRQTLKAVATYGSAITEQYGVSHQRQLAELYVLRLRYGIATDSYYRLRLFLPERRRHAWAYVDPYQQLRVFGGAIRRRPTEDSRTLSDKRRFETWCATHDLPTASIAAMVGDSSVTNTAAPLPAADLFSKPASTNNGIGVCRWRHQRTEDGVDRWHDDAGTHVREPVDAAGLLAALAAAPDQPYLVQARLVNHSDVADLSTGALATARVVTMRPPGGDVVVFRAAYRMPVGANAGDNFSRGGLAALVDVATGRLGPALQKHPRACVWDTDVHPDTGARITGRVLPLWQAVEALVLRAHAHMSSPRIVGWDVAITPDGPVLVEGNNVPGSMLTQMVSGLPLGTTPYIRLLLDQVEQAD